MIVSNKNEIPRQKLKDTFQGIKKVDPKQVEAFIGQDYFFTDNNRSKYDFTKIMTFNLLYSGGGDSEKANIFFKLVEDPKTSLVDNKSFKLIKVIENIVIISCLIVSDILEENRKFEGDSNLKNFQDLRQLYSTNNGIIRDFAFSMIDTYVFPSLEQRPSLLKQDFMKIMETCNYVFVKPHEIRKKYTEYVYTHRQ